MSVLTAIILGSWAFAVATATTKNVTSGFMIIAFITALGVSLLCALASVAT